MKKANLLKKTAFPRVPSISDGFVPLDGFGFKFVVSLSGVDIKIHGFNGSSWELLHETDGLTESYIAEVTHQKYFFESKSGEEQTVRVSFLSSEKEQNLGLRAGVSKETRKFHDIEEVPVYRSGMQGKMLTIMSNGTLAWLLANESFVIGEEGVQQPPPPANVVGLEEDAGLILHGNAQLINGVLELDGSAGTYASLPHSTEYERESGDMTINFWFNADSMPAETGSTFISKFTGSHAWDGWIIYYSTQGSGVGGTGPAMTNGGVGLYIDQTGSGQPNRAYRAAPAGGLPTGAWHHVAVTMPATGDYSLFVNGESILSWSPPSRNTSTNSSLMFGANAKHQEIGNFFSGKIDGVVIQKQILTAQEISDLHSAGRNASQPQPAGTLEEAASDLEPGSQIRYLGSAFVDSNGYLDVDGQAGSYAEHYYNDPVDPYVDKNNPGGPFTDFVNNMVNTEEKTVSAWFNARSLNDNSVVNMPTVFSSNPRRANGGFFLQVGPGRIYGKTSRIAGTCDYSTTVNTGEWYKVDIVQRSASATLEPGQNYNDMFVNGVLVAGRGDTRVSNPGTNMIVGGGWIANTNPIWNAFDGLIDGFTIVEEALTNQQILDNYNAEVNSYVGSGTPSIIDQVLNHPSTTIVGNPVYENNVLTLDGSSYMIHGDIAEFMYQDYMTTNLWFKNTGGARKSKLWSFGMAQTAENKYAHVLQQNTDLDLRFVSAAGGTINPDHASVDDGQWHMITAVWDNVNGVKRLYLDGNQLGSDVTFSAKSDPFRAGDDVYGLIIGTGTGAGDVRATEAYMGQFTKMEIENSIWDSSQIASKFAEGP